MIDLRRLVAGAASLALFAPLRAIGAGATAGGGTDYFPAGLCLLHHPPAQPGDAVPRRERLVRAARHGRRQPHHRQPAGRRHRDGFDIDCCRNVRVSNCTVNLPDDDGICPTSSFAPGYAHSTENVTISNCVIEECTGIALETVGSAVLEDVTITNIAMRRLSSGPLFPRLGQRMRGPADTPVGTLQRVPVSNITSHDGPMLPSIIAGVADHTVEDVRIADLFVEQTRGAAADVANRDVSTFEDRYPEPGMFGSLPASGFFIRQAREIRMSNVEIATIAHDPRAPGCRTWPAPTFSHPRTGGRRVPARARVALP